jgi:hypothetical protein
MSLLVCDSSSIKAAGAGSQPIGSGESPCPHFQIVKSGRYIFAPPDMADP